MERLINLLMTFFNKNPTFDGNKLKGSSFQRKKLYVMQQTARSEEKLPQIWLKFWLLTTYKGSDMKNVSSMKLYGFIFFKLSLFQPPLNWYGILSFTKTLESFRHFSSGFFLQRNFEQVPDYCTKAFINNTVWYPLDKF